MSNQAKFGSTVKLYGEDEIYEIVATKDDPLTSPAITGKVFPSPGCDFIVVEIRKSEERYTNSKPIVARDIERVIS